MIPANEIVLKDFHMTTNQDSIYADGCLVSLMRNISPHYSQGLMVPTAEAVSRNTATSDIDSGVTAIVPLDVTKVYVFTGDGKCYLFNDTTGTYTLKRVLAPGTGSAVVYNATVFGSYCYYAMEDKLGRFDLATETFNDVWASFTKGTDTVTHVMQICNRDLYIADAELIAIVNSTGVFTANALDIDPDYDARALYTLDNKLLIGASPKATTSSYKHYFSRVYTWNTWSVSFDTDTIVPEPLIHGFMYVQGQLYILAQGQKVKIYGYGDPNASLYCEIPQGIVPTQGYKYATVYPSSVTYIDGKWYFGLGCPVSVSSSEKFPCGIYTFHARNPGDPPTIQIEHSIPYYNTNDPTVSAFPAISFVPGYFLLFGYTSTNPTVTKQNGLAKVLTSVNPTATFRTGVIDLGRRLQKTFTIEVPVSQKSSSSTMSLTVYGNGSAASTFGSPLTYDSDRMLFRCPVRIPAYVTAQFEITISTANQQLGAVPESINILFD